MRNAERGVRSAEEGSVFVNKKKYHLPRYGVDGIIFDRINRIRVLTMT